MDNERKKKLYVDKIKAVMYLVGMLMNETIKGFKMSLELNKHEIKILREAIKVWQQEPTSKGFSTTLIGAMFSRKEDGEGYKEEMKKKMDEAVSESQGRETQSILLQAKLIQYESAMSEHVIDT